MNQSQSSRNVAIFGGSFDPPHIGHEAIMRAALDRLDIQKLIVVPAARSPFKEGHHAPALLRLAWLKKVAAFDKRIEVSDIEIRRPPPSYTLDTVRHFAPHFDTIYLIIGADNLKGLTEWHGYETLNGMVKWVVADRDKIRGEGFLTLPIDVAVSSTQLRKNPRPDLIPAPIREDVVKFYSKF